MAQITEVRLIDDLDGSAASETVWFGLDGKDYAIDLSPDNASKLRDAVAEFVSAGRRTGGATRTPRSTASKPSTDVKEAREWLREHGYRVLDKGRIPQDLRDIYDQRNVGQVADEAPAEEQLGDEAGGPKELQELLTLDEPELDTSEAAIVAWHESKGYKVNLKQMGLMRNRYLKAHNAVAS